MTETTRTVLVALLLASVLMLTIARTAHAFSGPKSVETSKGVMTISKELGIDKLDVLHMLEPLKGAPFTYLSDEGDYILVSSGGIVYQLDRNPQQEASQ